MYGVLKIYCEEDSVSIPSSKLPNALCSLGMNFSNEETQKLLSRALARRPKALRSHVSVFDLLELLVPGGKEAGVGNGKVVRARTLGSKRNLRRRRGGGGVTSPSAATTHVSASDRATGSTAKASAFSSDEDQETTNILQAWGDQPELPPTPNGMKRSAFGSGVEINPGMEVIEGKKAAANRTIVKKKDQQVDKLGTKKKKKTTKKKKKKKKMVKKKK